MSIRRRRVLDEKGLPREFSLRCSWLGLPLLRTCAAVFSGISSACTWSGLDYLTNGGMAGPDAGSPPAHFSTLGPNATLPTEAQCTAWVNAQPTAEDVPGNASANRTKPTAAWLSAFHQNPVDSCSGPTDPECLLLEWVTGDFEGSTDMILRWASCKWGIDEDVVRALAVVQSSWNNSALANYSATCASRNVASGALNYWSEPAPCYQTKGILGIRLIYTNAWPFASTSTPLNADEGLAELRSCMNGNVSYLDTSSAGTFGPYPATDPTQALWGCVGERDSGHWGDSGAVMYVQSVQSVLASRSWPR
jgi:autotransporter family porin